MSSSIVDALGRIPLSANLMATLTRAAGYAGAQQHRELALEHLLLALTEDPDAAQVLSLSRIEIETLKGDVSSHIGRMDDRVTESPVRDLRVSAELTEILQAATAAAEGRRTEIDGAIVLAAIVGDGRSASAHLLRAHGLTFETAIRALQMAQRSAGQHAALPPATEPQPQPAAPAVAQPAPQTATAPQPAAAPPQRPVSHQSSTTAEDILASARQRVQGRIAPGLTPPREHDADAAAPAAEADSVPAAFSAAQDKADALAAAERATDAEFERIAAEAARAGEPVGEAEPEHIAAQRPAPVAQRPRPPGALRPAPAGVAAEPPHGVPHAGATEVAQAAPEPVVARAPAVAAPVARPPRGDAMRAEAGPATARMVQPAPGEAAPERRERVEAAAQAVGEQRPELAGARPAHAPKAGGTSPQPSPAATQVAVPLPEPAPSPASMPASALPQRSSAPTARSGPSPAPRPMPPPPHAPGPGTPPAAQPQQTGAHAVPPHAGQPHSGAVHGAPPRPMPPGAPSHPAPSLAPGAPPPTRPPVLGQPASGHEAGAAPRPLGAGPYAGTTVAPRTAPPPMPARPGSLDAPPGAAAPHHNPAHHYPPPMPGRPPMVGAAGQATPPPAPAHPAPQHGAHPGAHEPPRRPASAPPVLPHAPHVSVAAGQLVENIPRAMRVAVANIVEARIARAEVKAIADGMHGGGSLHRHEIKVTKAMSVRLRAPEGGFFIEPCSPETQWIDGGHVLMSDDYASWRWTVTPKARGHHRLQLVVSARTVGPDGLTADTPLPDQVVEVRVRTNYAKAMASAGGFAAAAIAGGLLARFGEGLPQALIELARVVVK